MNVLLLLSALLSALTGVGVSARQPQAPSVVVQQVRAASARAVAAQVPVRPAPALATLVQVARSPRTTRPVFAASAPLYASRLRE